MANWKVSELLGTADPKPQKKAGHTPAVRRNTETWRKGLSVAQDGWKPNVTTDFKEVSRLFLQSRKNGTDGARRKNTAASVRNYEYDLDRFFGWLCTRGVTVWEHVTRAHVQEYVEHLNHRLEVGELASASVWKCFRTLRSLFHWIEKQQNFEWQAFLGALPAIPNNPSRQWIPSPETMMKFMEGFDRDTIWGFRDYVMATVMLDCGARIGELCNLKPDDVLWDVDMIVLFGKKQVPRKVSLSAERAMPLLRQWNRVREKISKCDRFFVARYGEAVRVNSLNNSWRKVKRATGVGIADNGAETGDITPHTFRHYFCTRFLVNGGRLEILQQVTGHTDLKTLQGYMHLAAELSHVKEEHRRVSPLDSLYGEDTKKKRRMY